MVRSIEILIYFVFTLFAVLLMGCGTDPAGNTAADEAHGPNHNPNTSLETEQVNAKAEAAADANTLASLPSETQFYYNGVKIQLESLLGIDQERMNSFPGEKFTVLLYNKDPRKLTQYRSTGLQEKVDELVNKGERAGNEARKNLIECGITNIKVSEPADHNGTNNEASVDLRTLEVTIRNRVKNGKAEEEFSASVAHEVTQKNLKDWRENL